MDKLKGSVLLTGLAAAMLGPNFVTTVAAAEPTAAESGDDLTEIVVTARRTEENLQDVPISIQVFNQQQLENRNVVVAQDLAQYVPSLSVNNNFGSDNTAFALRGFTQDNGTAPSVGVFFADVIAPRSASNSIPGGDGAGPGSFFDLENVQILKGPQGTLFGRNTTGGDILLVPKKPTSELSGYVEGGVGNYDDGEVQGVVNIPINDSFRVRAGVVHETREGYLHSNAPVGPKDFDDVDYTAARLSAVVDITPNLENYTIASYSTTDDNGGIGKIVAADTAINRTLSVPAQNQITSQQGTGFYAIQQPLQHPASRLQTWQLINTTTWKASDDLTLKNIASYAQLRDYDANAIFGSYFLTPTDGTPPFVAPQYRAGAIPFIYAASVPLPGSLTSNERTMTEEMQLQGTALDSRLTYQGGAYFELELPQGFVGSLSPVKATCADYSNALNCSSSLLATGALGLANETVGRTRFQDYAFYFQDTYKIADPLKVTTGIRWTHDLEQVDDIQKVIFMAPYPLTGPFPFPLAPGAPPVSTICSDGAALPACKIHLQQTTQAPTWLIDFDYTPMQDVLLYAKYTRGYREGSINPTAPAGPEYGPLQSVTAEKVDTYEVGEKFAFRGPVAGTVNGALFYNDFRNQQLQTGYNPSPTNVGGSPNASPVNAGKSRIWGAELDSSLKLFAGFRFDVGYTYLNTKILAVNAITLPADSLYVIAPSFHVGDQLVLSPRNKVSATPSYTLPLPDTIGAVTLSATYTYTSRQLVNYADRVEPALAPYSYVDATHLLNLNVNWNNILGKPVDLMLFATNVTKQQYYTFCSGLGGGIASNGFETCDPGAPMMFGARVKIRYN
jgi:iron complex outermembrane receptor protein